MTRRLTGLAASPGVAVAPAFVVEPADELGPTESPFPGSPERERSRLASALQRAAEELTVLAEQVSGDLGAEQGDIFRAQAAFATDPELRRRAEAAVDGGETAEGAVSQAFEWFRRRLVDSGNEYLAARAADLDDVRQRVLQLLSGGDRLPSVPAERAVLVARELTPSQTAELPRRLVAAIATERGSVTSHAALLARALGVPAVVGVAHLLEEVTSGVEVGVDGATGEVWLQPDDEVCARLAAEERAGRRRREELERLRGQPGATADGKRVELAANLGRLEDVEAAQQVGAEGSGLVRTEFLFLGRDEAPGVDEQAEIYRRLFESFPGHRVVIRTLDLGADKPLPFIRRPAEPNPALGVRGLRLGLRQPEVLRSQLRAILHAAAHAPCRPALMFPMVSRPEELDLALELVEEAASEEGVDPGGVEVGAMVEVPAVALGMGELARRVSFVSLGTNDLLQYLFAADRLLAELADLPSLLHPPVVRLVAQLVSAAHDAGAWVGVCGESAGSPLEAALLVGLGVDELSMAPGAIPEVKATLRSLSYPDLQVAARQAAKEPDETAARRVLTELVGTAR